MNIKYFPYLCTLIICLYFYKIIGMSVWIYFNITILGQIWLYKIVNSKKWELI